MSVKKNKQTTGDLLSLDGLLVKSEAISFARTCGSTLQLIPMEPTTATGHQSYFTHLSDTGGLKMSAVSLPNMLKLCGGQKQLEWLDAYFARNPCFGNSQPQLTDWPVFRPPPVNRVYAIYGVGLETEAFQFYKPHPKKKKLILDDNPTINMEDERFKHFRIRKGIAYETADTPQDNILKFTGRPGNNSGDGTVTYASLSYPHYWRKLNPQLNLNTEELLGVEHREILNNRLFFRKLIDYIAEKPDQVKSPGELTIRAKRYLDHYGIQSGNQDFVRDIDDESDDEEDGGSLRDSTEAAGAASGSASPLPLLKGGSSGGLKNSGGGLKNSGGGLKNSGGGQKNSGGAAVDAIESKSRSGSRPPLPSKSSSKEKKEKKK
eukprot:TRINITY_DN1114_c0_g1_i4.p2 TRINITY_DN1114_c0_g1~~TRINITY_DN1114_c0_g1_i4.p2  ORF type:complete len:377 (+),score=97.26 TRINITY_DN1114_c0_g1_i4:2018-3148(+)